MTGRTIRRTTAMTRVAAAVGDVTPGCEIFGCTKGDWSLVDLITHVLTFTGPADVDLATWTIGGNDVSFSGDLMTNGSIRTMRMLTDLSFPSRSPSYCAALRERFGDDAIRLSSVHAKFVVIRNDGWNVVIRTSMNLNENRRLETWEISDSKPMADWLVALMDELFASTSASATWARTPGEHLQQFRDEWTETTGDETDEAPRQFFGDGPVDVDLRRVGTSYR